jgi:heat shock protein HslJ
MTEAYPGGALILIARCRSPIRAAIVRWVAGAMRPPAGDEEDAVAERGRTQRRRRGRAQWLVAGVALLLAIVVGGCSILTDGLAGNTWVLTAITEQQPRIDHVVEPGNVGRYAIAFASDGTAAITADCNQVTATYTTTPGGGLEIVPGASTMAMCPDDSLGQPFVGALSLASSYNVHGNTLTMYLGNEGHLDFRLQD